MEVRNTVSVDPFSDRPELRYVKLPEEITRPFDPRVMEKLAKNRRIGVSEGKLRYVEVSTPEEPFHLKSFTLDSGESGRWTLEHQVPLDTLFAYTSDAKEVTIMGAIDPLNTNLVYLTLAVSQGVVVSVDMRLKRVIDHCSLQNVVNPSSFTSSLLVPYVLTSFPGSSPIPGKKAVEKNRTLADVLIRSSRH